MNTHFWGEHEIPTDAPAVRQIGNIRLWFKMSFDELWLAHKSLDPETAVQDNADTETGELSWSRWAFKKVPEKIRILPIFPDRSVVAKPEHAFSLAIGAQARIFVRVPLWLQIEIAKKKSEPLLEIPTTVMSNTWFGSFTGGELCYWLSTKARREIAADTENPHLVICPVQITNSSEDELLVDKLRLQVKGLSIFNAGDQLWADETHLCPARHYRR